MTAQDGDISARTCRMEDAHARRFPLVPSNRRLLYGMNGLLRPFVPSLSLSGRPPSPPDELERTLESLMRLHVRISGVFGRAVC